MRRKESNQTNSKASSYGLTFSFSPFHCDGNSADPDEMPPYAAFHVGLHCLPKYLFTSIQNKMLICLIQNKQSNEVV